MSNITELVLKEQGQIESIVLPKDWVPKPKHIEFGRQAISLEFSPPDSPESVLAFYYRGFRLGEESAENFLYALSGEPGVLSTKVIDKITNVLGNLANEKYFRLDKVESKRIQGKQVLVISGKWLASNKTFWGLMLDADGTGSCVQEIYFEAPEREFDKYINSIFQSLCTIVWKKEDIAN